MSSIFDAPLDESRIRFADLSAGEGLSLAELRATRDRIDAETVELPGARAEGMLPALDRPDVYSRLAEAAYRQTLTGELTTSRQIAQETGYDSIIATVRNASGVVLENPMRGAYLDQVPAYRAEAGLSPEPIENRPDIVAAQAAIFEQKLDALAQGNPELARVIGAARDLYAPAAVAQRADAEFKAAYEAAPSGAGALVASIAGGLPAMLRDPVNVAGLVATGGESAAVSVVGRIVSTMAREAAVNAGLTAVAQPLVQLERADLGLDSGWREGASNVAMAALLGAGFGTVFGGGRELIRTGPLKGLRPDDLPALERGILDHAAGAEISDRAARADAPPATVDGFSGSRVYEQAVDYVQGRDAPPPELLLDLPEPEPRRQRVTREELPARPGETSTVDGKPVQFERFEPADLGTDAVAFQYKGGGDAAGVTERLRSVTQWDPVASGKVLVFEAEDGVRTIADGHQRLGLAKRLSATDASIRMDGFVFKERDGWTRGDVRALAAKKNMQEGSGDAMDAARVLRDRPDLADGSLPTTAPMMRQALSLARLSDEAWGMTLNGVVPPSYAAAVGGTVADPLQHAAVLSLLRESQPETERAARLLIGEAMEAGFTVDRQIDLFGAADATRSLMGERVAVLDAALTALRKDARLFGVLARSADAIEAAGNALARGQNEARALNAAGLEDILVKLARRSGPISDALNVQAARVADGTARTTASKAFLDQLQAVVEKRGLIGLLKDSVELKPAVVVEPGSPEAAKVAGAPSPAAREAAGRQGANYEAWKAAPAEEKPAAAKAYLADWEAGLEANRSGGTASEPNSGSNVARQTGSAMTEPEWATSTASAGDQSASGSALTKAEAPSTESTAGRELKSRKYIEASEREPDSLFDAVPMGSRDDGRDARLLTREAALAEADRVELYSDLVAACRG